MKKCFVFLVLWILLSLAFRGPWAHSAEIQRWTGIVVHWSDSPAMTLDQCNDWHDARGWNGCGYNYIIQRDGSVDTARGLERIGAHAKGYNSQFLGVCFVGNSAPTAAQLDAWKDLKYRLEEKLGRLPVFTHASIGSTECPGPALKDLVQKKLL